MGNIAYFEIPAEDIERAKKFYMKVFGWDIQNYPVEGVAPGYQAVMTGKPENVKGPNYEMSQLNAGGMTKRMFPGQPITSYVQVEDVDKSLALVKMSGGKQHGEKIKIPNIGTIAFITDTEGNILGLWQPFRMAQK
ncbi:VOC family protein [Candidatus Micrarchaeota archaeon]|nr:VOC family protein [Candidatus Micrarchaeota archaeon]